jgi:hypothetical protein
VENAFGRSDEHGSVIRQAVAHSDRRELVAVGAIVLALLGLHAATNAQYDFHRDSLYYMDSARHPAWGYVDYPPVTPTIAGFSLWLFGPSVWWLRLWPSLGGAVMVVLAWLIARELGGGMAARLLAATGGATSLVLLGTNWLFQTVTFDQLVWMTAFWLTARFVRTGDSRLWLWLGVGETFLERPPRPTEQRTSELSMFFAPRRRVSAQPSLWSMAMLADWHHMQMKHGGSAQTSGSMWRQFCSPCHSNCLDISWGWCADVTQIRWRQIECPMHVRC